MRGGLKKKKSIRSGTTEEFIELLNHRSESLCIGRQKIHVSRC